MSYEHEIGARYSVDQPWSFPPRLEMACRLAGGFKPEGQRGELGELMRSLVDAFDLYHEHMRRSVRDAEHGDLPDGVEPARCGTWRPARAC